MKHAILALSLIASPALAWDNTNNGHNNQIVDGGPGAQANAKARAAASASSRSASQATGGQASAGAMGGNASIGNIGGGGSNSYNGGVALGVPLGTGNASCGAGFSLGFLDTRGGASGGGGLWELHDCKRAREAALLHHLGFTTEAVALLCQIDDIRDAFGGKCPDSKGWKTTTVYPYDYCATRNAGDKNQHFECDRSGK